MDVSGKSYASRAVLLRHLGYSSYEEYLGSDLWKRIRKQALRRDKGVCRGCGLHGNEVHHKNYSASVLSGEDLSALVCLCRKCHEKIEFKGDEKQLSLRLVNRSLDRLQSRRSNTSRPKRRARKSKGLHFFGIRKCRVCMLNLAYRGKAVCDMCAGYIR